MAVRTKKRKKAKRYEKEQDQIELLEKENRELKAINRSLLKQLKKLSRGINKEEYDKAIEEINEVKKEPDQSSHVKKCPECSRASLTEFIIAGRLFERCNICDYKSKAIKREKK